jgi:hypothetical protein
MSAWCCFHPSARYFGFKLLAHQRKRITNFFEHMDPGLLRACLNATESELQRVGQLLNRNDNDLRTRSHDREAELALWRELLKPRDSMVRFSESLLTMSSDPVSKLDELHAHYVGHKFANKEYQESLLEKEVGAHLKAAELHKHFREHRVGNDDYSAMFPLVELDGDRPVKAIKPLRLDHSKPAQIIDHGGQWWVRVEALRRRDLLPPNVLFAVNGVADGDTAHARAQREVVARLEDLGMIVKAANDRQAVIDFARR